MSSFSISIDDTIKHTQTTIACINSYIEYSKAKMTDIANWIAGTEGIITIPIEGVTGYSGYGTFALDRSEYERAISGDASITILDSQGQDVTIDSEQLIEAFNSQLSELKVQNLFLDYCHSAGESCKSSDFLVQVKSLFNDVVPTVMEKYAAIIDRSNDSIDAFSGFFNLTAKTPTINSSEYIKLVDGSQYEGSVWTTALLTIGDQISGFFSNVWQGIQNIGAFFTNIIQSLGKLVKWAIMKMFHQLETVYEKVGDDPTEVMDLPIIQCNLGLRSSGGGISPFINNINLLINHIRQEDMCLYSSLANNVRMKYYPTFSYKGHGNTSLNGAIASAFWDDTTVIVDGVEYACIHDVIIPSTPLSFLLRTGLNDNKEYIMSLYACFSKNLLNSASDEDIYLLISQSLQDLSKVISSVTCWSTRGVQNGQGDKAINYRAKILDNLTDANDDYLPLYDQVKNKMFNCSLADILANETVHAHGTNQTSMHEVILSLILWQFFMGRPDNVENGQNNAALATYELWENSWASESMTYDSAYTDGTFNSDIYRPYVKENPTPFSVHYQTTQEQADEVVKLFWGAVIAITVTIAAVKIAKWSKGRRDKTYLAEQSMAQKAWDYSSNPTSENLTSFMNARKKYRKMNAVNKILGIASPSSDLSSLVLPQMDSSDEVLLKLIKG